MMQKQVAATKMVSPPLTDSLIPEMYNERGVQFHRPQSDKKPRPLPAKAFLTSEPDD